MRLPDPGLFLRILTQAAWWRTKWAYLAFLYLLTLLLILVGTNFPRQNKDIHFKTHDVTLLANLQRYAFDLQMNLLREFYPRPAPVEPVLIGIDESTFAAFKDEPYSLWHNHWAQTLEALARARPAAVGMDFLLPDKSFEKLLPGGQLALIRSLVLLSQNTKAFYVQRITDGKPVPIHPIYTRMLSEENFATDQALTDPDRVARRFSEREMVKNDFIRPLPGRIAAALSRPVGEGYIDFSRGEQVNFVPMQDVVRWLRENNDAELKKHFENKVVLIGFLIDDQDILQLPVSLKLKNWDTPHRKIKLEQPGVLVHLQTLRSLLGTGLIEPLPQHAGWLVALVLATIVWVRSRWSVFIIGGVLAPLGLLAFSLATLQANLMLPLALWTVALATGITVRIVADALQTVIEKNRLRSNFAGSVSPVVFEEILAGSLAPHTSGHMMEVCVLFSDIRGFTALSERLSPEMVTAVLTRYFDRMVAVVHKHEGTLDKFIGDGMMVFFGAPRQMPDPCGSAVQCALDMAAALNDLNAEFACENLPFVSIGIGINYGHAVVGYIGSTQRHNYSAIGDVVNVASRVESLTKKLGCQVLITDAVKQKTAALAGQPEFVDHGEQPIAGHSPVRVWSVQPKAVMKFVQGE